MDNYRDTDLYNTFSEFCSFGAGSGSNNNLSSSGSKGSLDGSLNNLNGPTMDNARFAKFAKETGIVDNKTITMTDIDILFNKAKASKDKTSRRLDFQTFKYALKLIAQKKYSKKSTDEAYVTMMDQMFKGKTQKPVVRSTVADTRGTVFDKLTDTTQYTGTHKLRFNEEGKGRGLAGRVDQPKRKNEYGSRSTLGASYNNLSNSKSSSLNNVNKLVSSSHGSLNNNNIKNQPQKTSSNTNSNTPRKSFTTTAANVNMNHKNNGNNNSTQNKQAQNGSSSVFDRLTNVTGYTGAHKHRFNNDGTGRGLAGRESISKSTNPGKYRGGDVKDLSQILRT